MYKLKYSPQAKKDAKKLASSKLKEKAKTLLLIISHNPYAFPPEFEFLSGNLKGLISIDKIIHSKPVKNILIG